VSVLGGLKQLSDQQRALTREPQKLNFIAVFDGPLVGC
jgi:hypothetical protein